MHRGGCGCFDRDRVVDAAVELALTWWHWCVTCAVPSGVTRESPITTDRLGGYGCVRLGFLLQHSGNVRCHASSARRLWLENGRELWSDMLAGAASLV